MPFLDKPADLLATEKRGGVCTNQLTKDETLDLLGSIRDLQALLEKQPTDSPIAQNLREAIKMLEGCLPERFKVFL